MKLSWDTLSQAMVNLAKLHAYFDKFSSFSINISRVILRVKTFANVQNIREITKVLFQWINLWQTISYQLKSVAQYQLADGNQNGWYDFKYSKTFSVFLWNIYNFWLIISMSFTYLQHSTVINYFSPDNPKVRLFNGL